jgi:ERCC4-type nuclease
MEMYLDTREHELMTRMPTLRTETLPVGDIVIRKDGKDLVLIERKAVNDLASSITDGRYREQSFRLMECGLAPHRIVYLIEGSLNASRMPKTTIMSAMVSMWFSKGFTVVQTASLSDTVEYLNHLMVKLQKEKIEDTEYVSTIKSCKKDKATPQHVGTAMLAQIPSISPVMAAALLEEYESVPKMIQTVSDAPERLSQFTFGEKRRKLNKTNISNLKQYLSV